MTHYTKEELESYRDSRMSVLRRISCAAHLRECKACSDLLKELDEEDKLIHDLRASVQIYRELSAGPANPQTGRP